MSPNKHGNSVTIFNLSTSTHQGCKVNVLRGCMPASQAEVDSFNITEFPCLLGHTVYIHTPHSYSVYSTLYPEYSTLYPLVLYTTLYIVHCMLYAVFCTLYSVHCTLYAVHCKLQYSTMYTVHCTLYNCTLYTILYTVHYVTKLCIVNGKGSCLLAGTPLRLPGPRRLKTGVQPDIQVYIHNNNNLIYYSIVF